MNKSILALIKRISSLESERIELKAAIDSLYKANTNLKYIQVCPLKSIEGITLHKRRQIGPY